MLHFPSGTVLASGLMVLLLLVNGRTDWSDLFAALPDSTARRSSEPPANR
jgi:hypothetical protein